MPSPPVGDRDYGRTDGRGQSVAVDLDSKTVTVGYDEQVRPDTLITLIEDQGYDVAATHHQAGGGDQQ